MSLLRHRCAAMVAAVLCAHAPQAAAAIFCVNTVEALDKAFDDAYANGASNEIRVQIGKYALASTPAYFSDPGTSGSLKLSGGWFSLIGSCDTQIPDATLTEFDGNAASSLYLQIQGKNPGDLGVANLSIVHPGASGLNNAGLLIGTSTAPSRVPTVYVDNVIVTGCRDTPYACGVSVGGDADVVIRNALVADNTAYGVAGLMISSNTLGSIVINHATIADNTTYALSGAGLNSLATVPMTISNSILWNNGGSTDNNDCDLGAQAAVSVFNSIVGKVCVGTALSASGLSSADPLFAGLGDYRPKGASPARDSGVANPVGGLVQVDLAGHARTLGAAPDRGAYEFVDTVFKAGFE